MGRKLVLILLAGVLATAAQGQQPPADPMHDVVAALSQSIPTDKTVRDFAVCNLRAAYWGGYDVKVKVGVFPAMDGKARVYEWTKGKFQESLDPNSKVSMAEVEGKGDVIFRTKEEAFAKGVPFFIADATMVSPGEMHYTVHSNPQASDRVYAFYESVSSGENAISMKVTEINKPLSAKPEPQMRVYKFQLPLNSKESNRFSMVSLIEGQNSCLASNTIDLNALLKTAEVKP